MFQGDVLAKDVQHEITHMNSIAPAKEPHTNAGVDWTNCLTESELINIRTTPTVNMSCKIRMLYTLVMNLCLTKMLAYRSSSVNNSVSGSNRTKGALNDVESKLS
ncbi:hypothetical protein YASMINEVIRUS_355 [Yasminevirus sp. GU-2018]|uniref:Uncharacterized protein n=1 Tax=Yasminevirus sp. GU-2018 TaxID=2420051 RepID=A0A5K0U904_9VIRU|nr:hypothetical protein YASMINEVIRUS_355 [Yasminevirus sp. GU-2018]